MTMTTCHSLCRCTCGDYYEVHVFTGLVSEFEPESHDVDCDHAKASAKARLRAPIEAEDARKAGR